MIPIHFLFESLLQITYQFRNRYWLLILGSKFGSDVIKDKIKRLTKWKRMQQIRI